MTTTPKHKNKHPWNKTNRGYKQPPKPQEVAMSKKCCGNNNCDEAKYSEEGVLTGALAPAHGSVVATPAWRVVLDSVPDVELLRYLATRFRVEYDMDAQCVVYTDVYDKHAAAEYFAAEYFLKRP